VCIFERLAVIKELLGVEVLVVLVLEFVLVFLPERNHAVESFDFDVILVFRSLALFLFFLGLILGTAVCYLHFNGKTDIVGVLLYE